MSKKSSKELRSEIEDLKYILTKTYNILGGYDPEKKTPFDEVRGLILTTAHKSRTELVKMCLEKSKIS